MKTYLIILIFILNNSFAQTINSYNYINSTSNNITPIPIKNFDKLNYSTCKETNVKINIKPFDIYLNTSYSQVFIDNLSKKYKNHEHDNNNFKTLGLYETELEIQLKNNYKILSKKDRFKTCINEIYLTIPYKQTIYIANELPKNSCTYKMVLEHEKKHAQIQIDTLTKLKPEIQKILKYQTNYFESNSKQNIEFLVNRFNKDYFNNVSQLINQKLHSAQAEIDTPQSYRNDMSKCPQEKQFLFQLLK